ncbi:MAG TPA: hypothetical protein VF103_11650, partial [Polyangiaceae bacterium]
MKRVKTALAVGLPLVALAGLWLTRSPDHGKRAPRPRAALATTSKPATEAPTPIPVVAKAAPAPVTPTAAPEEQAEKARLVAEGEANRILAREARYDELDWDAPRPGPPPPSEPRMGKREAKLTAEDKLEQTVQMISLLNHRIEHLRARANAGDARMLERLEHRVADLNGTAETLRTQKDAPASGAPAGSEPKGAAPGDSVTPERRFSVDG